MVGRLKKLAGSVGRFAGRLSRRRPDWKETAKGAAAGAALGASVGKIAGPSGRTAGAATGAIAGAVIAAVRTSAERGATSRGDAGAGAPGTRAGAAAAGATTAGHATGYEDAIARRIAGLEGEARTLREEVEREQATVQNLTRDNAALRRENTTLGRRTRHRGWAIILLFATALAAATALAWTLLDRLLRAV